MILRLGQWTLFFLLLGIPTEAWAEGDRGTTSVPQANTQTSNANRRGQASKMAAFGAVMASSQCTQAQFLAHQAEDGSMEQILYQQMARQQCEQAAKSAQAARDNGGLIDPPEIKAAAPPSVPNYESAKLGSRARSAPALLDLSSASPSESQETETTSVPELNRGIGAPERAENPTPSSLQQNEETAQQVQTAGFSIPNALRRTETDTESNTLIENSDGTPIAASAANLAKSLKRDINSLETADSARRGARRRPNEVAEQVGTPLAASSGSGGYDDGLDALVDQMFGAKKPASTSQEIAINSKGKNGRRRLTIFEYASFRFRKAAFKEKRINFTGAKKRGSESL